MSNSSLGSINLTNANFSGANLSGGMLQYTQFNGANMTNVNLTSAYFNSINLSGADLRGASYGSLTGTTTTNTILYNGVIAGLQLATGCTSLNVRNYSPGSYYPAYTGGIHVQGQMNVESGTTLIFTFDGNPWASTISFDSDIPVTLAGNLELDLASGVSPESLWYVPIRIFDWTGVNPSGTLTVQSNLPEGYSWDTSQLYTSGVVTEIPEPATLSLLCLGSIALTRRRRK